MQRLAGRRPSPGVAVRPFLSYAIGVAGELGAAAAMSTVVVRAGSASSDSPAVAVAARQTHDRGVHAFYFTRGIYSEYGRRGFFGRGGGSWATDYPKADLQFLTVLRRLTNLDAYNSEHAVRLDDPE